MRQNSLNMRPLQKLQLGGRSVISVMSLPGSVAGASGPSAADRMQSQAFILAGRLPLTSAALPKSDGCIGSDLGRLETFGAEPDRSGADDAPEPTGRRTPQNRRIQLRWVTGSCVFGYDGKRG